MREYINTLFATPRMVIAQIIGALAMVCAVICFQQKDRKKLLIWQFIVCLLWTVHFLVLGQYTGAALNGVQVVRSIIFGKRETAKWANWFGFVPLFIFLTAFIGIITWKDGFSIFPIIGTVFATISLWMKKPFTIRSLTFPVSIFWGVYDVYSKSIAGALNEVFVIASLIIAIIRIDIPQLKGRKTALDGALQE